MQIQKRRRDVRNREQRRAKEMQDEGMRWRVRDAKFPCIVVQLFAYLSPCLLVACAISAHYCCNQADKGFTGRRTYDTGHRTQNTGHRIWGHATAQDIWAWKLCVFWFLHPDIMWSISIRSVSWQLPFESCHLRVARWQLPVASCQPHYMGSYKNKNCLISIGDLIKLSFVAAQNVAMMDSWRITPPLTPCRNNERVLWMV